MTDLLLRRVPESRQGAEGQDDYDVIGQDGLVIGRIFKANRFPNGTPWQWSLAYGQQEDHTPTHGYEPTRGEAMQAFARSWQGNINRAGAKQLLSRGPVGFWEPTSRKGKDSTESNGRR
jgi:hypothetical protein